jgi:hypothetical protein
MTGRVRASGTGTLRLLSREKVIPKVVKEGAAREVGTERKRDPPIQSIKTGVPATSKCSNGLIPNFDQQSTIANKLK